MLDVCVCVCVFKSQNQQSQLIFMSYARSLNCKRASAFRLHKSSATEHLRECNFLHLVFIALKTIIELFAGELWNAIKT